MFKQNRQTSSKPTGLTRSSSLGPQPHVQRTQGRSGAAPLGVMPSRSEAKRTSHDGSALRSPKHAGPNHTLQVMDPSLGFWRTCPWPRASKVTKITKFNCSKKAQGFHGCPWNRRRSFLFHLCKRELVLTVIFSEQHCFTRGTF